MRFIIQGGAPLSGEIALAGAKTHAPKLLIASLLTDGECVFENFPMIGETEITAELCKIVGSKVEIANNIARIKTEKITNYSVTSLSRKNRIPILALGPLLSRIGKAEVPILGGDKIGPRPVDIHIGALEQMGAKITENVDGYSATAPNGLRGADIKFRFPSVTATENVILAAVLAKGKTTVDNAAVEPDIADLVTMLQKMGAIIELGSNRKIFIEGVKKLSGVRHRVLPDRNEAVTFACLAVAVDGKIKVRGAIQEHLITFLNAIRRVGGEYDVQKDGITFWRARPLTAISIKTDTHPGFMTDWQQPFSILLTQASGISTVHETIYEDRFAYAKDLNTLGAQIKISEDCVDDKCRFDGKGFSHSLEIHGPTPLHGAKLQVRDLRAGIAHVIAALVASEKTDLDEVEEIYRGYERIDERLKSLGAKISLTE